MRVFISRLLVFCFICLFFAGVILYISSFDNCDKDYSDNSNIISLQTKSKFDSLDILFIGNSYCSSSIIPEILYKEKVNTYNLGIGTAGVEFYELITSDYLSHVKKYPKEVFILLSLTTFSSLSDNYYAYPINRYLETPVSNFQVFASNFKFSEIIPSYRKSFYKAITSFFEKTTKHKRSRVNEKRGFVSNYIEVTNEIIKKEEHLYLPLLNNKFDYSKIKRLEKFTEKLESLGIKVKYFELPTNKLEQYFNFKYIQEYKSALHKLKSKNDIFVINKGLFSNKHYRNIDHMNTLGAIVATREFVKYYYVTHKNKLSKQYEL